jgi:hypothetical protein
MMALSRKKDKIKSEEFANAIMRIHDFIIHLDDEENYSIQY